MDRDQPSMDPGEEVYGHTERQLAFKLLASHAMVDPGFYKFLHDDPALAAASLHIMLTDDDIGYIKGIVQWDRLDQVADEVRDALQTKAIVGSIW
jgi:hypothetical protein